MSFCCIWILMSWPCLTFYVNPQHSTEQCYTALSWLNLRGCQIVERYLKPSSNTSFWCWIGGAAFNNITKPVIRRAFPLFCHFLTKFAIFWQNNWALFLVWAPINTSEGRMWLEDTLYSLAGRDLASSLCFNSCQRCWTGLRSGICANQTGKKNIPLWTPGLSAEGHCHVETGKANSWNFCQKVGTHCYLNFIACCTITTSFIGNWGDSPTPE